MRKSHGGENYISTRKTHRTWKSQRQTNHNKKNMSTGKSHEQENNRTRKSHEQEKHMNKKIIEQENHMKLEQHIGWEHHINNS